MSRVVEIKSEEWDQEVRNQDEPVVVDFWHHMCGWCIKLNPLFEQLPEKFENVKFVKVNILESSENRKIAVDNGVMGTPTIKVFCHGRDVGEIVGFRSLEELVNDIKEILSQKDYCLEQSTPLE